jgi:histidinol-phosphatase (PHP family)
MVVEENLIAKVSVHGGHSGAFCGHAADPLEAIIARYIELGFEWVCLTEHMPNRNPAWMPPEEAQAGLGVSALFQRFDCYFAEARRLALKHAGSIDLLVGFETEAYSGYQEEISGLLRQFQPDMIVGSVHQVHDLCFDASPAVYARAIERSGGIENLYCDYFDLQLELIEALEPSVVGHFDLIRIFDSNYRSRWQVPRIRARALRNLQRVGELGLILDLNTRAFGKGASEPYLSEPWLKFALSEGIAVVPGDDSHGVASVGMNYADGVAALRACGGSANWLKPGKIDAS